VNIIEGPCFVNKLKSPFNYSPVKVNTLLIIKSIWKKKSHKNNAHVISFSRKSRTGPVGV